MPKDKTFAANTNWSDRRKQTAREHRILRERGIDPTKLSPVQLKLAKQSISPSRRFPLSMIEEFEEAMTCEPRPVRPKKKR